MNEKQIRKSFFKCLREWKSKKWNKQCKLSAKEFPKLRSQIPCLWTRSKFISTVGSVSLEVVKKYIEEQKNK